MAKLSAEDVLKLAQLSRLRLSNEEIEKFRKELTAILEYVEILSSVDTTSLEPTYQVTGLKNVMRDDEVRDYGYQPSDLLKNAPQTQEGQFKVKRVL